MRFFRWIILKILVGKKDLSDVSSRNIKKGLRD